MLRYTTFHSPLWEIIAVASSQGLTHLHMVTGQGSRSLVVDPSWRREDALFVDVRLQVLEYLRGERREFSLPFDPQGTAFQKRAWQALRNIPYGQTRTYRDMAVALGNPRASRAVGRANSQNPIPLIIPCHRVIGSKGALTGFAHGLEAKQTLLSIEASSAT